MVACAYVESYFQEILGPTEESIKSNRAYKVTLNFLFKYSWRGLSKREVRQAPRYILQLLRQRSKSELLVVLWSMRSLALLILYTIPFSLSLADLSSRVVPRRSLYDIFITLIHRGFSVKKIVTKLSYLSYLSDALNGWHVLTNKIININNKIDKIFNLRYGSVDTLIFRGFQHCKA